MQSLQAPDVNSAVQARALHEAHTDVTGAADVHVQVAADGHRLWVNVNGICLLRVCRADRIRVENNAPNGASYGEGGPARTMRWARLCQFVNHEASMLPKGAQRAELLAFCVEEAEKATRERRHDTAQYLQHIIDDLAN
jgi:hypothetical protein